jgi:hypothetical protein
MQWILIAAGLVAIIAGVLGKEFTVADVNSLEEFRPVRKSSVWSGRAVFIGVATELPRILHGYGPSVSFRKSVSVIYKYGC